MGLIPTLNSFSVGQVISSSQFNSNFTNIRDTFNTYAVLTDTAKTISASHVWSAAQKFADGAVGTPSITFNSDTNTGLYWIGADNFGLAVGGAKVIDVAATTVTLVGDLKFTDATYDIGKSGATRPRDFFLSRNATIGGTLGVAGVASFVQGNASSAPAIAFTGDANTGVNSPAADTIGLVVGGSTAIQCTASVTSIGAVINGPNGAVGAPTYAFTNDADCGMYRIGTNNIGLAVNGAKVLDIATTGVGVTGNLTFASASARITAGATAFTLYASNNTDWNQTWYDGGIVAYRGVTSTTGADAGEPIIANAKYFQGQGSSTTCYSLIGINASDEVQIDPEGRGITTGYRIYMTGGAFDDVTYPMFRIGGGLNASGTLGYTRVSVQTTNDITTAKKIASFSSPSEVLVCGSTSGGGIQFLDKVVSTYGGGTPSVKWSTTVAGAPAARTYTQSNDELRVALASGTYGVRATVIESDRRL